MIGRDALTLPAGSRSQKGYTVEVTDGSGKPVSDAAVACRLPEAAPTGTFSDGSHSAVVFTGPDGRADISGIRWGSAAGTVAMRVTANKGIAHAGMLVEQMLASAATLAAPTAMAAAPARIAARAVPEVTVIHRGRPVPGSLARPEAPREEAATMARPAIGEVAATEQIPQVSITKAPANANIAHSSKKKWIILAILAGAAAGAAGFAAKGKSSSPSTSSGTQMSIGTPTISVGHP